MGAYSVYLHLELLEVVPARGEQRRLIMSFVRSLADNPHGGFDNAGAGYRRLATATTAASGRGLGRASPG